MDKSSFSLIHIRLGQSVAIAFIGIFILLLTSCSDENLYLVYDDGKHLYITETHNPNPKPLLPDMHGISPDASADGQYLSFISDNSSGRLAGKWGTGSKIEWDESPEFGTFIFNPTPINKSEYLFSSIRIEENAFSETSYMDIYSSGQNKNITNFRSMDFEPSVSPNGNILAFTTSRISNSDIYTNERPLSDRQAIENIKEWNITERGVIYNTYRDHNIDIFISNIDGTNPSRLTSARALDHQPDWSHNGDWIIFTSLRHDNSEIFVIGKDGNGLKRLTNNQHNDEEPSWSPDGDLIAFISDRSGSKNIYTMNPDGTNQIQITNTLSNLHSPTWIKCNPGILGRIGKTCP